MEKRPLWNLYENKNSVSSEWNSGATQSKTDKPRSHVRDHRGDVKGYVKLVSCVLGSADFHSHLYGGKCLISGYRNHHFKYTPVYLLKFPMNNFRSSILCTFLNK